MTENSKNADVVPIASRRNRETKPEEPPDWLADDAQDPLAAP